MGGLLIRDVTVVASEQKLPHHAVRCVDGRIAAVGPAARLACQPGDTVVEGKGGTLCPGLLDLHIHGVHNVVADGGAEAVAEMSRILPRYGVTAFLPTLVPRPRAALLEGVRRVRDAVAEGAAVVGIHIEGPYLGLPGALAPEGLGPPSLETVAALIAAAAPLPLVMSVSPEVPGVMPVIRRLAEEGVPVFITHTAAGEEETRRAIAAGAMHATHFYNVFPVPEVAEPGVRPCGAVEVLLAHPETSVDFILDGEHVSPTAVALALACKGPDRVCLISDANAGAGLPPGRYGGGLGGQSVEFAREGGPARLLEGPQRGALAGSGLTLDKAVRNAMALLGLPLERAVCMASTAPARVMGLTARKGRIGPGVDADLVLLDAEAVVMETWVGARSVYRR